MLVEACRCWGARKPPKGCLLPRHVVQICRSFRIAATTLVTQQSFGYLPTVASLVVKAFSQQLCAEGAPAVGLFVELMLNGEHRPRYLRGVLFPLTFTWRHKL